MKMTVTRLVMMAVLVLVAVPEGLASQVPLDEPQELLPCGGLVVDPWVTDRRDRSLSSNPFVEYAVDVYGPPLTCEGVSQAESDGLRFGTLRLGFAGRVIFVLETLPPEISITTLRATSGFDDEEAVRAALEMLAADIGLEIDWSVATTSRRPTS